MYIKHLEGRLYDLAKAANRYDVKNDTTPGRVYISDDELDTMDTYVEDILIAQVRQLILRLGIGETARLIGKHQAVFYWQIIWRASR